MNDLWLLFSEFFKTGLFAVGGGLATLPFLYQMAEKYPWFTEDTLGDMIAVSESTPGPMGVNMATYSGFTAHGIFGALVAVLGLILPSVVIIMLIGRALKKFSDNKIVENIFNILRPAVTGLIASVALGLILKGVLYAGSFSELIPAISIRYREILLFIALFILIIKYKKHPVLYISVAAFAGIVMGF